MSVPTHWSVEHGRLRDHIKAVKDANRSPINEGATYLALYFNVPANALTASEGGKIIGFDGLKELGFNILAEAVRAGKAQIVQPLQPRVTPIGGTFETTRACEGLGQVIDGIFQMCNFTGLMEQLLIDGACTGEGYGIVELDPKRKDFSVARLDPLETFHNSDRTEVVTTRMMSRRKALAYLGVTDELRAAIRAMPTYKPEMLVAVDNQQQWDAEDNVAIYCGWTETLGNDDGTRVMQLSDPDGTVVPKHTGPWKHPLPVFSFQWDHGHRGNDSKPLGRTIAPMHYWLNKMVRKMHDALQGVVPTVVGTKDPKWSDVPYQFIRQEPGDPPVQVIIPHSVSQDVRQEIVDLREQVYRETGLSEEAAAGSAPPQFKSGVALSTWKKIINQALSQQHRNHDGAHQQATRIFCSWAPEVYANKQARALARGTDIIKQIDFKKVNLPEDSYSVGFDPVSDLPKQIPYQLEMMGFMEEKGWIDGDEVLTHLNIVDFRAAAKRRGGPRALMELQIAQALGEGELIPPSEMQDHQKLAELAGQAYQAAQAQYIRPPNQNMQALLHLYLLAKARVQPPAAPPAPGPAPTLPTLTPEVAPALDAGTVAPPAAPLPIV
jgi:hypothetical protein